MQLEVINAEVLKVLLRVKHYLLSVIKHPFVIGTCKGRVEYDFVQLLKIQAKFKTFFLWCQFPLAYYTMYTTVFIKYFACGENFHDFFNH